MPWIPRIVSDVHAVKAQVVVIRRKTSPVIVKPESAHGFERVAVPAEGVNAGIGVCIMVVLEEPGPEEIARETVALRRRMAVVQMDRDLVPAKAAGGRGQVVFEADERREAIGVENRLGRVFAV